MRSKSILIYYKKNDLDHSRLGISASKKFGNAIKRNLFKRIIRETFRLNEVKNSSFDILVVSNNRFSAQKDIITEIQKKRIANDSKALFEQIWANKI